MVKRLIKCGFWWSHGFLLVLVLDFVGCTPFGQIDAVVFNRPKTLYVSALSQSQQPDGKSWKGAFTSLQQAVDVAVDGDTILVDTHAAPYTAGEKQDAVVHIRNRNGLKILGGRSSRGAQLSFSVLDGEQLFDKVLHVVWIENSKDITLSNFTFQNGEAQEDVNEHDLDNWGAGVLVDKSSNIELHNVRVVGNKSHWGGAVAILDSSNVKLVDCELTKNEAMHRLAQQLPMGGVGGAVAIKNSRLISIQNSTFKNNVATVQAGGLYGQDCQVDVVDSVFEANGNQNILTDTKSALAGGAVSLKRCEFTAKETKWKDNAAQQAGAVLANNAQITFEGGEFTGNFAAGNAAAVSAQNASVVSVRNVQFIRNNSEQNGAALSVVGGSRIRVEGATFRSNQAGGSCPITMVSQGGRWQDAGRNVYQDNVDSRSLDDDAQGVVCKP